MIDLTRERLVALSDVPKLKFLPRRRHSGRLHISTIYRWAQHGVKGVRLETIQLGGTKVTSIEALSRFFEKLTSKASDTPSTPTRRRENQSAAAERDLDEAGF